MVFEFAQYNMENALRILPFGNGTGNLVEEADAGELLLQRRFGTLPHLDLRAQIVSPRFDALFQFSVGFLQSGIARLDLPEHLVEAIDELA